MVLTSKEKLDLINSIEVLETSSSCGEMEYISVKDNEKNREILHKIGLNDADIEEKCCPTDGELDIVVVGFENANFYDLKKKRFFNEE